MSTVDLLLFSLILFFRVSFCLFSVILTFTCHLDLLYNYLHTSSLRLSSFKETLYSSQWLLYFVIQFILLGTHSFYMIICWEKKMVQQFINGIFLQCTSNVPYLVHLHAAGVWFQFSSFHVKEYQEAHRNHSSRGQCTRLRQDPYTMGPLEFVL